MTIRRLTYGDIRLGELLPWDVSGDNGSLLVRKGYVPTSDSQLDALVARGFIDDPHFREHGSAAIEHPSVVRLLNEAQAGLTPLLRRIADGDSAVETELAHVAALVSQAVDVNAEVAVACILHNQKNAPYSVRHSVDTAVVAAILARAVKRPPAEIASMVLAALTMNVGMLDVQDERAALTDAEHAIVKAHPAHGVALLRRAGVQDDVWLSCVLGHHENQDGSGYPHGLAADAIGCPVKLIALADRYCARIANRPWRKPMLPNAALRDILLEANHALDAQLGAVLIRELGIYPVGTFVRLLNGEIGVVARKGVQSMTPHVTTFIGPRGARLDVFLQRDTRGDLSAIRDVLAAGQVDAAFRMDQVWGREALP